jgi:uncharacterized protein
MERDYTQVNQNFGGAVAAQLDAGLRQFMIGVYNYMLGALALTGAIAFFVSSNEGLMQTIIGSPLMWVVMLAPIGLVFFLSFRIHAISAQTAQAIFWLYAGLLGLGLSPIFLAYTGESVARAFFISAATFGGMSLYGYTTKRDLTSMGSFLIMGVWGIFIASIINIFLGSSGLGFVISVLAVLIFTGLTAYDTQKIKEMYYESDSPEIAKKKSVMGALMLYMDFINIFIHLLRLIGDRR